MKQLKIKDYRSHGKIMSRTNPYGFEMKMSAVITSEYKRVETQIPKAHFYRNVSRMFEKLQQQYERKAQEVELRKTRLKV
jgi:hypothetical protein